MIRVTRDPFWRSQGQNGPPFRGAKKNNLKQCVWAKRAALKYFSHRETVACFVAILL